MRPRIVMHNNQIERAKEIVKTILKDSIDIIVFEEIFDRKARKIISNGIHIKYKYSAGPGPKGILKLNSGVMIFSRFPLSNTDIAYFNDCKSADCIAKKAVVSAEIKITPEKKINLLGTHFQSINGAIYQTIRLRQMAQMKDASNKNESKNNPIIYAGDFNIDLCDSLFQNLTSSFSASPGAIYGKRKYSSCNNNTYRSKDSEESLIDHILLNKNGTDAILENTEIIRYEYFKNGKKKDLSDHYAVKTILIY